MKIVVLKPGKFGEVKEIDGSLESMQKVVDGYIEIAHVFHNKAVLICNEEGAIRGDFLINRGLYGTLFIVGTEGEEFVGLNKEQLEFFDMF